MSYTPYYKKGDHLAVCDRCGKYIKASRLRKEWTGLLVCPEDWEPRHDQEYVVAIPDNQAVLDARPANDTNTVDTSNFLTATVTNFTGMFGSTTNITVDRTY